jgi:hypothetical protein
MFKEEKWNLVIFCAFVMHSRYVFKSISNAVIQCATSRSLLLNVYCLGRGS